MPHIEGNSVTNNVARFYGGGICAVNGVEPTIVANRVFHNSANLGAGVLLETSAYFTVTNNFIAHNADGGKFLL